MNKRSVDLFDALNANDGTKFNFQELASNEHICSVEGHVVAIEAKGNASEYRVANEGNVLLVADTSELLCFDTKYIAGGPKPVQCIALSASGTKRTALRPCGSYC